MKLKNSTKKFISGLLLISIILPTVLFSNPKKAEAVIPVNDPAHIVINIYNGVTQTGNLLMNGANTGMHIKDIIVEVLKEIGRTFAKRLLQKMTASTVKWINEGFHGSPFFVENPGSFFKDIAKTEIKDFVQLVGYDSLRMPFGKNFAVSILNNYQNTFSNNAQYTLSRVINDPIRLSNYRTNFNYGGWNGFLTNTQYPQNNYMGYQMMATDELAKRLQDTVQSAAKTVKKAIQDGGGFLSSEMCETNPEYNKVLKNAWNRPSFKSKIEFIPPTPDTRSESEKQRGARYRYADDVERVGIENAVFIPPQSNLEIEREAREKYQTDKDKEKTAWDKANSCKRADGSSGLVATTPGSVIGNQINNALGSSVTKVLGATAGNSIAAILDALLNKFFSKLTGGLTGSGTKNANEVATFTGSGSPGSCGTGGTDNIAISNLKTESDCVSLGGTWITTDATAGVPVIGTCNTTEGGRIKTTESDCNAIDGQWTTVRPVIGTCTTQGGATSVTIKNDCDLIDGEWNTTPPPMGTCTADGDVSATAETYCKVTLNGSWSSTPFTEAKGTCAIGGSSSSTTQIACSNVGGIWTRSADGGTGGTGGGIVAPTGKCTNRAGVPYLPEITLENVCSQFSGSIWVPNAVTPPGTGGGGAHPPVCADTNIAAVNGFNTARRETREIYSDDTHLIVYGNFSVSGNKTNFGTISEETKNQINILISQGLRFDHSIQNWADIKITNNCGNTSEDFYIRTVYPCSAGTSWNGSSCVSSPRT